MSRCTRSRNQGRDDATEVAGGVGMRDTDTSATRGPAAMTPSSSIGVAENTPGRDLRGVARALLLGRQLGVHVVIDTTGWLSHHVEVVYQREHDSMITPLVVKVGRDASDEDVLPNGSVLQACRRYNSAIGQLHGLRRR